MEGAFSSRPSFGENPPIVILVISPDEKDFGTWKPQKCPGTVFFREVGGRAFNEECVEDIPDEGYAMGLMSNHGTFKIVV
jgi:hypothetical protein